MPQQQPLQHDLWIWCLQREYPTQRETIKTTDLLLFERIQKQNSKRSQMNATTSGSMTIFPVGGSFLNPPGLIIV